MTDCLGIDALTPAEKRSVLWGFLWRGFIAAILSAVAGGMAGAILGFLMGSFGSMLGFEASHTLIAVKVACGLLGPMLGILIYWQYLRSLFRAMFGSYVLRFVRTSAGNIAA